MPKTALYFQTQALGFGAVFQHKDLNMEFQVLMLNEQPVLDRKQKMDCCGSFYSGAYGIS